MVAMAVGRGRIGCEVMSGRLALVAPQQRGRRFIHPRAENNSRVDQLVKSTKSNTEIIEDLYLAEDEA